MRARHTQGATSPAHEGGLAMMKTGKNIVSKKTFTGGGSEGRSTPLLIYTAVGENSSGHHRKSL